MKLENEHESGTRILLFNNKLIKNIKSTALCTFDT